VRIERVRNLSAHEFRTRFLDAERPVIIEDAFDAWPARTRWTPDYFKTVYGDVEIQAEVLVGDEPGADGAAGAGVAVSVDGKSKLTRLPGNRRAFRQQTITLREYFERLEGSEADRRWFVSLQPITRQCPALQQDLGQFAFYRPWQQRMVFHEPLLWIAPVGTVSKLHFDRLPNLVTQFWGHKKWLLFPRSQMAQLYLPSELAIKQFSPLDVTAPDLARYPKFADATPIELTLRAGETLFIPTDWPHHVITEAFSISMNFWWATRHEAPRLPAIWLRRLGAMLRGQAAGYGG
jgi:lysine-specific demethylase 8